MHVRDTFRLKEETEKIDFHKQIADSQRESYNKMRTDFKFLKEILHIEIDYKQKIVLGKSPRQRSMDYNDENMPQRPIYYVETSANSLSIKCLKMDLIFHHSSQTCVETIKGLEFARNQEVLKNIDKNRLTKWTDCGNHFRYVSIQIF